MNVSVEDGEYMLSSVEDCIVDELLSVIISGALQVPIFKWDETRNIDFLREPRQRRVGGKSTILTIVSEYEL